MSISIDDKIAGLYIAFFNRAADKEGLDYWSAKADGSNTSDVLKELSSEFAKHTIFSSTYDGLNNQQFVESIYLNVLNNEGDSSGISYWKSLLDNQMSRSDMVSNFVEESLTTELTSANFPTLTEDELTAALSRQNLLTNKTLVSQDFVSKLGTSTNITDTVNIETDVAYLASIKILNEVTDDTLTVTNATAVLEMLGRDTENAISTINSTDKISNYEVDNTAPTITNIEISSGNYIPNSIIDIVVTFSDDVTIDGIDSTLSLIVGEIDVLAKYAYKTANSIVFKYTVEDGISDTEQTVKTSENSINLNNTTIKDDKFNNLDLTNEVFENTSAIINDTLAPTIVVDSAHYTSTADKLVLNGSGFSSILEKSEDFTADVASRFDFTKMIWDIDGNYTEQNPIVLDVTDVAFTDSDVSLVTIDSDTQISIIFEVAFSTLENMVNYGHSGTVDTLDISTGFVQDTAANISTDIFKNNILLGIDNTYYGTTSADTIMGTTNNDIITGSDGNDTLYGKGLADIILGENGDDTIVGGLGIDTMSGGSGADTFVFAEGVVDTIAQFTSFEGIDIITDLNIDSSIGDKIDLSVTVTKINTQITGTVDQATFVENMNTLLNVESQGFDSTVASDISSTIVTVDDGDLSGTKYLVVDLDANDMFTTDDFIVKITGATVSSFDTALFV